MPRDASLQHRFQDLPDIGITEACPGDLFFFSEPGEGITHVAMSLGGGDIIHSSGWIKCESLDSNSSRYNHQLHSIFTTGKDVTRLLDAG